MNDDINDGDETDRCLVTWDLNADRVVSGLQNAPDVTRDAWYLLARQQLTCGIDLAPLREPVLDRVGCSCAIPRRTAIVYVHT